MAHKAGTSICMPLLHGRPRDLVQVNTIASLTEPKPAATYARRPEGSL